MLQVENVSRCKSCTWYTGPLNDLLDHFQKVVPGQVPVPLLPVDESLKVKIHSLACWLSVSAPSGKCQSLPVMKIEDQCIELATWRFPKSGTRTGPLHCLACWLSVCATSGKCQSLQVMTMVDRSIEKPT